MTEIRQQQLFRTAPASVCVTAGWRWPVGWHVTIATNYGTLESPTWVSEYYCELSTDELLDVITVELGVSLGVRAEDDDAG